MNDKKQFELQYLFKTSPRVLEGMISTAMGLSEWFAEDVTVKEDIYTFFWDGSEESARLISKKSTSRVRFQWLVDEEEGNDYYFELSFEIDPMTKTAVLSICDFSDSDEMEEAKRLWNSQINELKRVLGA
jgi:hypothetical protein